MRRIFNIFILIISLSISCIATADGDQETVFRVREGFIYNFLKFVKWPDTHSFYKAGKANICIVGDHPFAEHFISRRIGHTQDIAINVREPASYEAIPSCHILFVGKTVDDQIAAILTYAQHHPVLTISEIASFADHGGIIEIATVDKQVGLFSKDKLNLRINLKTATTDGLAIDARLLQIAQEIVK